MVPCSVPAAALELAPGLAGCAIAFVDVREPPSDLGPRVGSVIDAVGLSRIGHLVTWVGLGDAARAGSLVARAVIPAALCLPEIVEALELRRVVPMRVLATDELASDRLVLNGRVRRGLFERCTPRARPAARRDGREHQSEAAGVSQAKSDHLSTHKRPDTTVPGSRSTCSRAVYE